MNSYNFTLASSGILLITSIIVAFAITYFSYRKTVPEISSSKKSFLIFFRTFALSILLFILIEPIIEMIGALEIKPRVVVLLDNSTSSGIKSEKINNYQYFSKALESINDQDLDNVDFYRFGNETILLDKDSIQNLNFRDQTTNIDEALRRVAQNIKSENIKSVILVSDGNFNTGNNPLYESYLSELEINPIVIGDTNKYKDIVVNSVITNEVAYVNTTIPIEANISVNGFQNDSILVSMVQNGEIIDKQSFFVVPSKSSYRVMFQYESKKAGTNKITISVKQKVDEVDFKNNQKSVFIKILDDKKQISIFAGAPSYDVSTISKFLSEDNSIKLNKFIQKKGSDFYNTPTEKQLNETGLFVFIGFPNKFTDKNLLDQIKKRLESGTPYLMIFSKDLDNFLLNKFSRYLPFKVISSSKSEFQALPYVEQDQLANSIINLTGNETDIELWNSLPPLFRTETFLDVKQGAETLVKLSLNGTKLNEPLVITQDLNNTKSLVITGYGLHRWKLETAGESDQSLFERNKLLDVFLSNAFKWLSIKENKKKLKIQTDKNEYINGQAVMISATLYDDKLELLDDAEVQITIENESENRELILSSNGNGKYSGVLEGLDVGDYKINARANYKQKLQGTDQTRFTIGELALENLNYNANIQFLKKLASQSGGKIYSVDSCDNIIEELKQKPDFIPAKNKEVNLFELWEKPWLLGIAILMFSIEWFIRRKSGLL